MARIGLLGRITLILMAALCAVMLVALGIGRFERRAFPTLLPTPYPRLEQAAGLIEVLRRADASLRPTLLRAVNTASLSADLVGEVPPDPPDLRRAPRIEAMLRTFCGDGLEGELRAYTSADAGRRAPSAVGTEGPLVRAVWRMPDGNVLVLAERQPARRTVLRLLGLPPGLWIGLLGVSVAALALFTAQRELRPLRRLTEAAARFDGSAPAQAVDGGGAPDIQRLAEAVHAMQQRVAGLLGERSFLIGAISHDLKTYLTRLRLRAEALPGDGPRERMVGDLDAMTDLIDTALAFARGTAVSPRREVVDLADLAAVEAAERAAVGQPVAFASEEVADALVQGDAVALRRVLANLVDNAVTFGRARVEIEVEAGPAECQLRVHDDGPGVADTESRAIFSPFYRTEASRNRRTGGSGLGLAIARQIVEGHGGVLDVSAGRLGGACFTVRLPRSPQS